MTLLSLTWKTEVKTVRLGESNEFRLESASLCFSIERNVRVGIKKLVKTVGPSYGFWLEKVVASVWRHIRKYFHIVGSFQLCLEEKVEVL